ncbi:MAG: hypothetical protein ABI543_04805 [Ignavibacteria bacterium]
MNNLSLILLAVLFSAALTGFVSNVYSQDELVMDSIITGNKYKITMYNDKEVIGKVVKQDSVFVYMVTDAGTVRIKFEDIFSVSKSTVPRLMDAMFTLGGGILLQGGYYDGYNTANTPGFSIQATGLYPFSENKAIRLDLSFGRFSRDRVIYAYYGPNGTTNSDKQNVDVYSAYADIIFGNFNNDSKFSIYGLGGVGVMNTSERSYDYTYYNPYDSTNYNEHYPGYNFTYFSLALGGGLRFKLSKKIGAFAEVQYDLSTGEGFFLLFGRGYFPIRAGLTYSFY